MIRVAVFVDGNNVFHHSQKKGTWVDYEKFFRYLENVYGYNQDTIYMRRFYTGTPNIPTENQEAFWSTMRQKMHFTIVKRPIDMISDENQNIVHKGDTDFLIGLEIGCFMDTFDVLVIVSGDSDLVAGLQIIAAKGKKVLIFSFRDTTARSVCDLAQNNPNVTYCPFDDIWNQISLQK